MVHTQTNNLGEMPIRLVIRNGIPVWQASGRTFPVVAGAEDPPDGANNDNGGNQAPPPHPPDQHGDDDDAYDKDRALATIRKLREAERLQKQQLKELESLKAEQKKRDDAEKSETDRLREQIAESQRAKLALERELQETRNRGAIERAATKAGATDAADVFRLLDMADFEQDDSGNVTNAEKLVTDLLKAKPYLAGKTKPQAEPIPGTPRSNGQPGREDKVKENEDKLIATGRYTTLG